MRRTFKARHAHAITEACKLIGITSVRTVTVQKGRKRVQRVVVDVTDGEISILKISVDDVAPIGGW